MPGLATAAVGDERADCLAPSMGHPGPAVGTWVSVPLPGPRQWARTVSHGAAWVMPWDTAWGQWGSRAAALGGKFMGPLQAATGSPWGSPVGPRRPEGPMRGSVGPLEGKQGRGGCRLPRRARSPWTKGEVPLLWPHCVVKSSGLSFEAEYPWQPASKQRWCCFLA